jgi:hypothetical protein
VDSHRQSLGDATTGNSSVASALTLHSASGHAAVYLAPGDQPPPPTDYLDYLLGMPWRQGQGHHALRPRPGTPTTLLGQPGVVTSGVRVADAERIDGVTV